MAGNKGATTRTPVQKLKSKVAAPAKAVRSRGESGTAKTAPRISRAVSGTSGSRLAGQPLRVVYVQSHGVDEFVSDVCAADPMRLIETERAGVAGAFVKDLSRRMEIPAQRMFDILGVPKATAEKKVAAGELLSGSGGRAAIGIARLLGMASGIVSNSTAPEARDFDAAKWLGRWLETPQSALGGRKPAELVDTPTGFQVVARLLGAIESGAYQ
jgi:putative toxin-antitoxin system antitoxin component (TIGR02293 family)